MMRKFFIILSALLLCGCGGSANSATFDSGTMVNVADYGVVTDGVTDNKSAVDNAIAAATAAGKDVYFPDGTYLYLGVMNGQGVRFIGQSKAGTIIKDTNSANEHNLDGAEDITFWDFKITDYGTGSARDFTQVKFKSTVIDGSYYMFYQNFYSSGQDFNFQSCDFEYDTIYAALWLRQFASATVNNCTFNGTAAHPLRIVEQISAGARIEVTNNTVNGGITGIFFGSSRGIPFDNVLVEWNVLSGQTEEGISFDGFGNNPGLVPTICNGTIDNVTNDNNGKLVVGATMVYHDGVTPNQPCPITLRNDWANYYATLGQGTGQGGTVAKIIGYDNAAGTITMDSLVSADNVTLAGDFGVQSGFFNPVIRHNRISECYGTDNTYATAISIYLNVFGALVDNNTVTNCAHGINVAGGLMLSTYETLAWNNVIRGNTFTNVDQYAVGAASSEIGLLRMQSYYGGRLQYGNQFINNKIIGGGRFYVQGQDNLTVSGNYNDEFQLIYFKVAGTSTKFNVATKTLGGVAIPQAVCVVADIGGVSSLWSAMADDVVKAAVLENGGYLGVGLSEVQTNSPGDYTSITTGTQHTFMGWDATTGALQ